MELLFNDLSINPLSQSKYAAINIMYQFARTFKKSRDYGFKRIRSDISVSEITLTDQYTIHSWLMDSSIDRNLKGFMFGSIVTPFIDDTDPDAERAYVESNYLYLKNGDTKIQCLGMAAAYINELPCISLNTAEEWQKNELPLRIETGINSEDKVVYNVFSENCFENPDIKLLLENLGEVELIKSQLNPDDKEIQLSDHHGKNELKILCERLKNCDFVTSMRSASFGGNSFIRKLSKDGTIEITLVQSKMKYALKVQTTGRNFRETQEIAKILKQKYA